jgi:hypothetical protein
MRIQNKATTGYSQARNRVSELHTVRGKETVRYRQCSEYVDMDRHQFLERVHDWFALNTRESDAEASGECKSPPKSDSYVI